MGPPNSRQKACSADMSVFMAAAGHREKKIYSMKLNGVLLLFTNIYTLDSEWQPV